MDTLACAHAWIVWEEQQEQPELPNVQISAIPSLMVLLLILAPVVNLHPAIAATLLTQANQSQNATTSQNDPQPEVEGSSGTQPSKTVNAEGTCKTSANSGYLGIGSVGEGVRLLQIQLNNWGFPVKNVDGIFGPKTCAAVIRFQERYGLEPDGIVGPRTSEVLWASRAENRKLQAQLNNWGFSVGDADGIFDTDTRTALVRFQNYHGLEPDGIIGPQTSQALWTPRTKAIAQKSPATNASKQVSDSQTPAKNNSQNLSLENREQSPPTENPAPNEPVANVPQNPPAENSEQSPPAENSTTPPVVNVPQNPPAQNSSIGSSLQEPPADQKSAAENPASNSSNENRTENRTAENTRNDPPEDVAQSLSDAQNQPTSLPQEPPVNETQGTQANNQNTQSKGNCDAFINALGERESGEKDLEKGYKKEQEYTDNLGRYQFGEALLKDLGYYDSDKGVYLQADLENTLSSEQKAKFQDEKRKKEFYEECKSGNGFMNGVKCKNTWEDGKWKNKEEKFRIREKGWEGRQDFLDNKDIQDQAIREAFGHNWEIIKKDLEARQDLLAPLKQSMGKIIIKAEDNEKRLEVTKSGILAAAHLSGAKGIANFLLNSDKGVKAPADELGTKATDYLENFSHYEVQEVEGCIKIPKK